jgi:PAS domain S-box-containing protein
MVEKTKPLKVAIVGGGSGCKAIMDMIFAEKLSQLRMKLIGVACTNPNAVGYSYAQQKGIYTTRDYHDLYKLKDLNIIIELTGRQEVANEISRTKPDRVTLMDHVAARLFWDIFQIEEKSIADRKGPEEALRKAHDQLELQEQERTAELVRANEKLKLEIEERKRAEQRLRKALDGLETVVEERTVAVVKAYKKLKLEIEERKRAEEALRESEEKYRTVLEASPDPIVVYDKEGNVIYLNPAFTRVFGWTSEELLGNKIDYVPGENWPETQMMIDIVLAGGGFSGVKSRRYTKKRSILDVSISVATYQDPDGIPVGSVHTLRDITERKRVEEELREARDELERRVEERTSELSRSNALLKRELNERKRVEEELQKKNEELENFVNVVSHDLKTPIIGVEGLSYRLLKHYQEKLDERGRMYLEKIRANVRRMEVFVSDLLSLAKTGHVASTFRDVAVCEIVEDLTLHLQPRLKVKGIKLAIADNLPTIYCDRDKISQVFENLLVNATKFIGDTKNPRTEIGYEDKGDFIQFFVRDNGIGIDAKYHKQIL